MSSDLFPAQSSILCSQALADRLQELYPLQAPVACSFFQIGLNDTYAVKTAGRNYYLRVSRHNWRSMREIEAEIELLNDLKAHQIPVAAPVRSHAESFLFALPAPEGTRYAVLFEAAEGGRREATDGHCRLLGEVLARIHRVTDQMNRPYGRFHLDLRHLFDEPIDFIEPFLAHRNGDLQVLRETARALKDRLTDPPVAAGPEYGICHGDLNDENYLSTEDGRITLFDFDCFGYGRRAYDLAVFLWSRVHFADWSPEAVEKRHRQWEHFLKGYSSERNVTDRELAVIPLFVPARHIWHLGLQCRFSRYWGRSLIHEAVLDQYLAFLEKWGRRNGLL